MPHGNVQAALSIAPPPLLAQRSVLIVDDADNVGHSWYLQPPLALNGASKHLRPAIQVLVIKLKQHSIRGSRVQLKYHG